MIPFYHPTSHPLISLPMLLASLIPVLSASSLFSIPCALCSICSYRLFVHFSTVPIAPVGCLDWMMAYHRA
uniref:Putative secreted peptide n=1 Tax=Anopheles braziliensis TaxID=58242 RepID=A0A2M3ZRD3_9DIPT